MPNLRNWYKSTERQISQKNPEYMLKYELILIYNKAAMDFKMDAVTKNRHFFNCPLLLYYQSK
jgi:hypothetical protein